jgi:hypothetical protein
VAAGAQFLAGLVGSTVYGSGVMGHDHLVGVASTGGDFNVLWEPVLVLFTNTATPGTRITTLAQIEAAVRDHQAAVFANPDAIFPCSVEGPAAYEKATPVAP